MKRRISLVGLELGLSFLWGICFVRAYNFYTYTQFKSIMEGSGDAATDFDFSKIILFCYSISFIIALVLVWLAWRKRLFFFSILSGMAYLISLFVLLSRPERVIILFPDPSPILALLGSLLLALVAGIGVAVIGLKRRFSKRQLNLNNASVQ